MPNIKWFCNTIPMTANIKILFIIMFNMVHNHRLMNRVKYVTTINNFTNRFVWEFTNDRFTYIARTIRFTNTQWVSQLIYYTQNTCSYICV